MEEIAARSRCAERRRLPLFICWLVGVLALQGADLGGATNLPSWKLEAPRFGYTLHLSEQWGLSPSLAWDWVDEEHGWETATVVTVAVGYGF